MKKLLQYSLIIVIIASSCIKLYGQNIQWASELVFQYNSFKATGGWSGEKILGEPDAYPYGSLNENALRLLEEKGYGTVTLGFENGKKVAEVVIAESFAPGRVSKVVAFDEAGTEFIIYEQEAQDLGIYSRLLTIPLDDVEIIIKKLTLHVNCLNAGGWSQIDAVGLSDSRLSEEQKQAITKSDKTIIEEEISFSATREKLSGFINTEYQEIKPVISPDGRTLYFARQDYPSNIGGKRDPQDIYFSDLVNEKWRLAQNIGAPLNDKEPNGICSISPDGNTMLVINSYGEDGSVKGKGVSVSYRLGNGWTQPVSLSISGFENKSQYQDFYLSNSSTYLLMAIQMPDSHGDQDLYISFRNPDGTFSTPKNLGVTINTSEVEYAPFLASDNKTLYFSSDGHGGVGGSDIFYTKRLDESWTRWTTPVNIGDEINSAAWDGYYTVTAKGDFAYFISDTEDGTGTNIYRIEMRKELKPDPVVLITGRVLDRKTNRPIEAEIDYQSLNNDSEVGMAKSNAGDGEYKIVLPAGNTYGFMAKARGYISMFENTDFSNLTEYKEIEKNLYLIPIEVGQVVQLNNLFFVQSESEFMPESEAELDKLYEMMTENPSMRIELKGHTDNQGYYKSNMKLSQERAEAVMNYLIEKGISKKRVVAQGYGPTQPLYSNSDPEKRALNRRVEVEILEL